MLLTEGCVDGSASDSGAARFYEIKCDKESIQGRVTRDASPSAVRDSV